MPRRRPAKMVTLGGRKLRRLVRRHDVGISGFAKLARVERVTLHRVMTGDRYKQIPVDFAVRIHEFEPTIAIEDFCSVTAIPVDDVEEEAPARRRAA